MMLNSMQKLFLVLALPGKADYFVSAFIVLFMLKNIPLFQAGVTGAAMSGVVAGEGGGRSQTMRLDPPHGRHERQARGRIRVIAPRRSIPFGLRVRAPPPTLAAGMVHVRRIGGPHVIAVV